MRFKTEEESTGSFPVALSIFLPPFLTVLLFVRKKTEQFCFFTPVLSSAYCTFVTFWYVLLTVIIRFVHDVRNGSQGF